MEKEKKDDTQPGWLQRVQEQSWEPELIISGLTLFALFQVPDLTDQIAFHLETKGSTFFSNSTVDELISTLVKISVYILIAGFLTHIFLRSIWVAYAGLSYLYRDGINEPALHLPKRYRRLISNDSYEEKVKSLEKICSGIFSLSFLFFMIILGLINISLILSALVFLMITFIPGFNLFFIFNLLFLCTGFLYIVDLLTLGVLRRLPYLNTLYYPFYRVGRALMLGFLYEDIYYGFLSNNRYLKAGILNALFVLVFVLLYAEIRFPGTFTNSYELALDNSDTELLFSGHYEDRISGSRLGRALIPSDIVRDNVLRLFIPHLIQYETEAFIDNCREQYPNEDFSSDNFKLSCLNDLNRIALNDSVYSVSGLYQYNSNLDIYGMVYWLDLSDLPRGSHTLTTSRQIVRPDTSYYIGQAIIEFFKDAPALSPN